MTLRRLLYLLTLAVCLVFYGAYQEWFSYVLLMAVVGFPWLSLLLSLPAMLGLRLEPEAGGRVPMGSCREICLAGRSRWPQPPMRGKIRVTKNLTGEHWVLKPGQELPTEHCGALTAVPARARVYDYSGLFGKKVRKTGTASILVLPRPVEMEVPPDLTRYLARSWRPKFGGGYAENHELRLYRPGDSLNQVHWKLSAKTGKLILREPMEPERGLVLLTMDISGTPGQLDIKFGRLLWLGDYLLERGLPFEVRALTGGGIENCAVADGPGLQKCVEKLLGAAPAAEGSIRDREYRASWLYHIGGETDET